MVNESGVAGPLAFACCQSGWARQLHVGLARDDGTTLPRAWPCFFFFLWRPQSPNRSLISERSTVPRVLSYILHFSSGDFSPRQGSGGRLPWPQVSQRLTENHFDAVLAQTRADDRKGPCTTVHTSARGRFVLVRDECPQHQMVFSVASLRTKSLSLCSLALSLLVCMCVFSSKDRASPVHGT